MVIKVEVQNDIFNDSKLFEIYEASEGDYNEDKEVIEKEWQNKCINANHTTAMFEFYKETLEEHGIIYLDLEEDISEIIRAKA